MATKKNGAAPDALTALRALDPQTSPGQVAEIVVALAIQAHVPVYLVSEPGVGKSAVTRAIADAMRLRLWTLLLSVREPTDQGGLPAVYELDGEQLVRMVPPGWARELIYEKRGIVFLDEVTAATPATQNSALRVVQEGVAGDSEKLPAETSFVLAGNPASTNLGANDLTGGMANRCLHVAYPHDYERWRAGMLRGWAPEDRPIVKLPAGWRDGIPDMRGAVVAFLDTRTQLAQCQPTDLGAQGGAWPSGRTWELTAQMLAAANAAGYPPKSVVARMIVLGLVGEAAQIEWSAWLAEADLPATADVIANPSAIKLPERQDQILAVLSGVVAYVAQRRNNVDVYMRAWTVVTRVLEAEPSLAIRACRDLAGLVPPGAEEKNGTPMQRGFTLVAKHLGKSGADYGRQT